LSLDLTTLRLLKHRDKHDKLVGAVPAGALEPTTRIILNDFGRWFREHPDVPSIDFGLFPAWFKSIHPNTKDEALAVFNEMFHRAKDDIAPGLEKGIVKRWFSAEAAANVTALLEKWNAGDEVDLHQELKARIDEYEAKVVKETKSPQVLTPIEDMLLAEQNDEGISWPWACFNKHIKPMVGGDFIVLAMRPDKGKSTACAQIATHAAPQIDTLFPGQNRCIMWLNNEGPGKRIVLRTWQSALNLTTEELVKFNAVPDKDPQYRTQLRRMYAEAVGGRMGVLRVMDIHDWWNHEVEDLFKQYNPALVIFDMIDNIKFGGSALNNGQRTDQLLEGMYQWARLMGVKYDFASIANSQVSADGDGLQYPSLGMLKDSKTGKQGAADVIIVGGAVNDPMLENSRYWGTTKNKKGRTGQRRSPNAEMLLDPDRGRYVEPPQ